jgi:GDP-4-dehydro-6-deoxy-D-mannose reductase
MKILLTGGAGFVGYHLSRALSGRGHEVFIADRAAVQDPGRTHLVMQLENAESITSVIQSVRPECIIHLAAQSSVSASWKDPESTLETNILGSVRLFQTMIRIVPDCRFVFIGSGEEYGTNCSEDRLFTEGSECRPANLYAVSKLSAGRILELLALRHSARLVHLRPFNHFGPRQREGFVIADFCAQIARSEKNQGGRTIYTGNLSAKRDFLYIDDVVRAYCLVAEAENWPHPVYNISTGTAHTIQSILDFLVSQAKVPLRTEIDPARFRPVEVPVLCAESRLMEQDFGWKPEFTIEDGLLKNLNWWREQV